MKKGKRFIEKYENELNEIINYFDKKKTLTTEDYEKLNNVIFLYNIGRLSFVESVLMVGSILDFNITKKYEIKGE